MTSNEKPFERLPSIKRTKRPVLSSPSPSTSQETQNSKTPQNKTVKKSFVPNLIVSRPTVKNEPTSPSKLQDKTTRNIQKERAWQDRPRREFIQTSSVFSDGVASQQMGAGTSSAKATSSSSRSESQSKTASKCVKVEVGTDSVEDIMDVDFIADLKNEEAPISLVKDAVNLWQSKLHRAEYVDTYSLTNEQDKFYLFQFPSVLPYVASTVKEKAVNGESSTTTEENIDENAQDESTHEKPVFDPCDLPEGIIGSFEILDSGKLRLDINGVSYTADEGFESNTSTSLFYQDLLANTLSHITDVSSKLICRPDVSQLLCGSPSSSSSENVLEVSDLLEGITVVAASDANEGDTSHMNEVENGESNAGSYCCVPSTSCGKVNDLE